MPAERYIDTPLDPVTETVQTEKGPVQRAGIHLDIGKGFHLTLECDEQSELGREFKKMFGNISRVMTVAAKAVAGGRK